MPPTNHLINILPSEEDWKQAAKKWHRQLLKMPVLSMKDSTKFLTGLPGCRTNQYLGGVSTEAQFYPYAPNKRGEGSTEIIFRELPINFGTMNQDFEPNAFAQTMLGENAAVLGQGQARSEMAKLILSQIMAIAGEHLELALATAERDPEGDTTMDLFDGYITIIEKEIAAGTIGTALKNYLELSDAIDATNVVEFMKYIEFGLDPRLRKQQRFCYCDPALVDLYNEGYQLANPALPYNKQYDQPFVEGSNRRLTFAPLPALAGSEYMIIAPKMNMIYGYDNMSDLETLEVLRMDVDTFTAAAKLFFGVQLRTLDYRFLKVIKMSSAINLWPDHDELNPATPTVSPTTVTLAPNATKQLTMSPDDDAWSFESSAEGKATVSDAGLITGVAEGSATITATHGTGADAVECTVAVTVTAGS